MSFTKRRPDRLKSVSAVLAAVAVTGSAIVSCSDSDRPADSFDLPDATPEASLPPAVDADRPEADAGRPDTSPFLDAARSDAAPAEVVCASSPCATALTATLDSEGFCALLSDKTVACWGQNTNAELGRGADAGLANSATPARVVDLADVVALEHTCALDATGGVWCWGKGPWLRSAAATTTEGTPVKIEIPPVTKLGVAAQTACGAFEDGIQCWGMNASAQIVVPGPTSNLNTAFLPQPIATPEGLAIRQLFVGNASFILDGDGNVVSWGANPPLGRVSSLAPDPYPDFLSLTGISDISAAADNACAVVGGIAYCWGSPMRTTIVNPPDPLPERKVPEPVFTPEALVQIATTRSVPGVVSQGAPPIPQRACAVSVTGAVYCWGTNGSGQAGDGTTKYANSPVKVAGLPGAVARVTTTPKTTCALLTTGAIHCWGDGFSGQLGRGKLGSPSLVPQEVLLP